MIKNTFLDGIAFEKAIYELLSYALGKSETLKTNIMGSGFDFLLPHGLKAMGWPPNTHVEVKYRLIYNSLDRILTQKKIIRPSKLIVIVKDLDKKHINFFLEDNDLEILSYEEILKKISHLKKNKVAQNKNKENDDILALAREKIKNNTVTFFLGAGVSASAGVVTWESLLEQLCIKNNLLKIDSDIESTIKGRFIVDKYKQRKKITTQFYKDMKDILYSNNNSQSRLIESIAKAAIRENIESIVSYNYDDILEQCINKSGHRQSIPIYEYSRLEKKEDLPVYHVHGLIPKEGACSEIVLGEREYHKIYQEAYNWGNVEQLHALTRNTCFFIGLSMKDPNLRRLLDISVQQGSERERVHFAFLRKIEYDIDFTEANMREFGINCIWYNNHNDLPQLIDSLIK